MSAVYLGPEGHRYRAGPWAPLIPCGFHDIAPWSNVGSAEHVDYKARVPLQRRGAADEWRIVDNNSLSGPKVALLERID